MRVPIWSELVHIKYLHLRLAHISSQVQHLHNTNAEGSANTVRQLWNLMSKLVHCTRHANLMHAKTHDFASKEIRA